MSPGGLWLSESAVQSQAQMCHLNSWEPPILSCSFVFPPKSLLFQRLFCLRVSVMWGSFMTHCLPRIHSGHTGFSELLIRQEKCRGITMVLCPHVVLDGSLGNVAIHKLFIVTLFYGASSI